MATKGIVLYLHVHQPWRVRDYTVFDTASQHNYFDNGTESHRDNQAIFEKVATKSYRPMNAVLQKLLEEHEDFKLSLSITGTFLDQAEQWAPDVIESFKKLVDTGRVEIVGETYHHSLAFFYSRSEFEHQVELHRQKIRDIFGVETTAFRNTELAYNDELAAWANDAGYKAILAEGWDPILEWRSPNHVYRPPAADTTRLLMKNYRLSDDLAFRFSNKAWEHYPLHADTYIDWIQKSLGEDGSLLNLFMDYETFGEHQWEDTGIFNFFSSFVGAWLDAPDTTFYTVTQAAASEEPVGEISMQKTVTWADSERDLSAWLGNDMQHEILHHLYALERDILKSGNEELINDWRRLTTSDHSYYMCTKWFTDGDVHAYFSPYDSPYDAFLYFMNVVRDLRYRLLEYRGNGGL
jgi:alpha-amylase